jgi:hypothetical protein
VTVETFPWPQTPTKGQIAEVAAAVALRALRREIMAKLGYSASYFPMLSAPLSSPMIACESSNPHDDFLFLIKSVRCVIIGRVRSVGNIAGVMSRRDVGN